MGDADLFSHAAGERLRGRSPLAARLRPTRLDDVVGQRHLLGQGAPLRSLIETDRLSSAVLWGPPGTGKTTIARIIAAHTSRAFEQLSAVSASVKDVREVLERAGRRLGEQGQGTILFLDEVHRFNRAQQDALLPGVEDGLVTLIGATTENPFFEINAPLLSRSTVFRLEPLDAVATGELVHRALEVEGVTATAEAVEALSAAAGGDGRQVLTSLEVAIALAVARHEAEGGDGKADVGIADLEGALGTRVLRYGRDEHYDVVSAFIKSVRGSDPDAALHYLARMLAAGEDARFIARRLVILASEDVGMADSGSLLVADAAARAVELVGLPEAALNLAHATVHLSCAPKSNTVTVGLAAARNDLQDGPAGEVPPELRDAHYRGASTLGHGVGYRYPHDDPRGWVEATYLPDGFEDRTYWIPGPHGEEPEHGRRLAERRGERRRGGLGGHADGNRHAEGEQGEGDT